MPATTTAPNGKVKTVSLSDLFAKRVRTIEIVFTDDPEDAFTLRYSPDRLTPETQARYEAAFAENASDAMADLMVEFIRSWSLTHDGEPYAVDRDNLNALGIPLMGLIFASINADLNANVTMGKATSPSASEGSSGT